MDMADVQGDMYGGPLKGDTPVDHVQSYTAQEIRQWVLDTNPDAISAAGNAYLDFKKAFQGDERDKQGELLGFLRKIGNDLDQAWGGPKSGAPECQQQLAMLWQSAQQLIENADALGTSLKSHGDEDSDHSLKGLKKYFHIKDSGFAELWGLTHDPSPFDNDVWEQTRISPDNGFQYKGTDGDPPAPGSPEDVRNRQIVDQIAQKKLQDHNALDVQSGKSLPAGTVNSTYASMPGYMTLELPPGSGVPQSPVVRNDGTPTGPNPAPKTTNPGPYNTGPNVPSSPQHTGSPSFSSPTSHSPSTSHLAGLNGPSSGSTSLSGLTPTVPSGGHTPGGPSLPGSGSPSLPGGGTPPPFTPLPPSSGSVGVPKLPGNERLPGLGNEELPGGLKESPFGPGSGSSSRGLIGGEGGPAYGGGRLGSPSEAIGAANAARAEEAAAMGATGARAGGMMPMMPMGGMAGMGSQGQGERNREAWMYEDEGVWTDDQSDGPVGGDGVIR